VSAAALSKSPTAPSAPPPLPPHPFRQNRQVRQPSGARQTTCGPKGERGGASQIRQKPPSRIRCIICIIPKLQFPQPLPPNRRSAPFLNPPRPPNPVLRLLCPPRPPRSQLPNLPAPPRTRKIRAHPRPSAVPNLLRRRP
jgi:hypothetical protein